MMMMDNKIKLSCNYFNVEIYNVLYLDFQILIGDEIDYKYIPRSVAAARNASIER